MLQNELCNQCQLDPWQNVEQIKTGNISWEKKKSNLWWWSYSLWWRYRLSYAIKKNWHWNKETFIDESLHLGNHHPSPPPIHLMGCISQMSRTTQQQQHLGSFQPLSVPQHQITNNSLFHINPAVSIGWCLIIYLPQILLFTIHLCHCLFHSTSACCSSSELISHLLTPSTARFLHFP